VEKLVSLNLPAGVYRNGTRYQAKSRWFDSHLVRWHEGTLRPIGGWAIARTASGGEIQATGKPRASWSWRKNDATAWLATGTQTKLYVFSNTVLTDITPGGLTGGAVDGTIFGASGGWGDGGWGDGPWGGAVQAGTIIDADTWSLDNFGEILVACLTSDGKLYESTPTATATQITNSPSGCRAVCVTPERFIFALGASSDPRNVAWCSQAARTTWTPSASNSAGSFPLQTPGRLMAGRASSRETLLWTDSDLWAATFIGGPLVYSFQRRGDKCGLIGPNAFAISEGAAYWMGDGQFWRYDGAVRQLACDVSDFVFSDLNKVQRAKIHAVPIAKFGEVWWFYPSANQSTQENNRYVMYNYRLGYWAIGALPRAAASDADVFAQPMMWATDGRLYSHETGFDHGGEVPFVESGPLEIGDGDKTLRIQRLIPDENTLGQVEATLLSNFYPTELETTNGPFAFNQPTDCRVTCRQARIRLSETSVGEIPFADGSVEGDGDAFAGDYALGRDFRVGSFRAGVLVGGGR
jgi:hypothetical protein